MRTFDERKAEILRRSEARIAERRQNRRRLLLCALPLVACVALTATFLPAGIGAEIWVELDSSAAPSSTTAAESYADATTPEQNVVSDSTDLSAADPLVELTLPDSGEPIRRYTDPNRVGEISDALRAILAGEGELSTYEENQRVEDLVVKAERYTITLVDGEGNRSGYLLMGDTLLEEATGRVFPMEEADRTALRAALGLAKE